MSYDTSLFLEIIESIQGILYLRESSEGNILIKYYRGIHGNLVVIDASFEDIESPEGKVYLRQLGIDYLIPSLFPDKTIQVTEQTLEKAKV